MKGPHEIRSSRIAEFSPNRFDVEMGGGEQPKRLLLALLIEQVEKAGPLFRERPHEGPRRKPKLGSNLAHGSEAVAAQERLPRARHKVRSTLDGPESALAIFADKTQDRGVRQLQRQRKSQGLEHHPIRRSSEANSRYELRESNVIIGLRDRDFDRRTEARCREVRTHLPQPDENAQEQHVSRARRLDVLVHDQRSDVALHFEAQADHGRHERRVPNGQIEALPIGFGAHRGEPRVSEGCRSLAQPPGQA
jgi:hypothetical protein